MAHSRKWQKLDWQDPFLLEQQLSDEQRMVRDSARQYAQGHLASRVQQAFRDDVNDPALDLELTHDAHQARIQQCAALLLGNTLPHDQVYLPGLVFQRHERNAARGSRTLLRDHETRNTQHRPGLQRR